MKALTDGMGLAFVSCGATVLTFLGMFQDHLDPDVVRDVARPLAMGLVAAGGVLLAIGKMLE